MIDTVVQNPEYILLLLALLLLWKIDDILDQVNDLIGTIIQAIIVIIVLVSFAMFVGII